MTQFELQAKAKWEAEIIEYKGKTTESWVNELADILFNSNNFITKKENNLKKLEQNILLRIETNSNNPSLYYLLGRINHGYLSGRVTEIRHLGREKALQDKKYILLKKQIYDNYLKALELDDKNQLIKLSGKMLAIIGGAIFSSHEMRIRAIKKEIKRPWGVGENLEYIQLSKLVTAYIDAKQYKNALSTIKIMESTYPTMKSEIEIGKKRINQFLNIEKEKHNKAVK